MSTPVPGPSGKTDKLDANGLATLLRMGSFPTVWLPPAEARDERELPRTRMALCNMRTALKNRIHSTPAKYALAPEDNTDLFSKKGRAWLEQAIHRLPPETGRCLQQEVELLNSFNDQVQALEARIREKIQLTPSMQLLKTIPGIGVLLAIVIDREIGIISRCPGPQQFSSYTGTTPRVSSSGGKTPYGSMRTESSQYLKWAFIEAANVIVRHRHHPAWKTKHVRQVYDQVCQRRGHAVAVGAVARHLAEAAFWILKRQQPYRPYQAGARARLPCAH